MSYQGSWGRLCLLLGGAAIALAGLTGGTAAQGIGLATDVDRTGYRSEAGATTRTEIEEEDTVFLLDRISTDGVGRLRLELDDSSVLVVGPDSRLTLDEFVYDGGGGSFVGNLSVGGFRFLSGDMPSSSYRIETPTAVVGLRGTDVIVIYDQRERMTLVIVLAGQVWVLPLGLDEQTLVEAGQVAQVLAGFPPIIEAAGPTPRWSVITTTDPLEGLPADLQGGSGGTASPASPAPASQPSTDTDTGYDPPD